MTRKKKSIVLLFAIVISTFAFAQKATSLNLTKGVALEGYDAVAYLNQNKAVKGTPNFVWAYNGGSYYFSSQTNLDLFKKDPTAYAPQYGGWCAYAMGAKGEKVEVDPETFKIVGGKLFLFYNKYFTNTLTLWNKDEKNLRIKADANWAKIVK